MTEFSIYQINVDRDTANVCFIGMESLEKIKKDNDLENSVLSVREGLDEAADQLLEKFINPETWLDDSNNEREP